MMLFMSAIPVQRLATILFPAAIASAQVLGKAFKKLVVTLFSSLMSVAIHHN
jgi:hypothetical protein